MLNLACEKWGCAYHSLVNRKHRVSNFVKMTEMFVKKKEIV